MQNPNSVINSWTQSLVIPLNFKSIKFKLVIFCDITNRNFGVIAKKDWEAQNLEVFPKTPGDDKEYVPLPKTRRR